MDLEAWAAVRTLEQWNTHLGQEHDLHLNPSWDPRAPLQMRDGTWVEYRPDRWGVHEVKCTPTLRISVMEMAYNYRVVSGPIHMPMLRDGGWCYFGRDPMVLARALHVAWEWDPHGDPTQGPAWADASRVCPHRQRPPPPKPSRRGWRCLVA
ncbi:hypothetical protein HFP72_01985 [Nocardiopsis sp. ARC36]